MNTGQKIHMIKISPMRAGENFHVYDIFVNMFGSLGLKGISPSVSCRGGWKCGLSFHVTFLMEGVAHIVRYYDSSFSISFNIKS